MNCEYDKYIDMLQEGKLNPDKTDLLYNHAAQCDQCSNKLKQIETAEEFVKAELSKHPYNSNKASIMKKIERQRSIPHIFSTMYRTRRYAYGIAMILLVIGIISLSLPLFHNINHRNITSSPIQESPKNSKTTPILNDIHTIDSSYVKISSIDENVSILKLYPGYVPAGLNLSCRMVIGNQEFMQFDGGRKQILINIAPYKADYWMDEIKGKNISDSNGNWLLYIDESEGDNFVKFFFKLNSNIYVRIDTCNISGDDIIKVANSIKETEKQLRNDTNDQAIIETLGPKLQGNTKVTIQQAIKIVQHLGFQYKVEGVSTDEYDKQLVSFSVKNFIVTLKAW